MRTPRPELTHLVDRWSSSLWIVVLILTALIVPRGTVEQWIGAVLVGGLWCWVRRQQRCHLRNLCPTCASRTPLNPSERADRLTPAFRVKHWAYRPWLGPVILLPVLALVLAPVLRYTPAAVSWPLCGLGSILYIGLAWVTDAHATLQPWCRFCQDGGRCPRPGSKCCRCRTRPASPVSELAVVFGAAFQMFRRWLDRGCRRSGWNADMFRLGCCRAVTRGICRDSKLLVTP